MSSGSAQFLQHQPLLMPRPEELTGRTGGVIGNSFGNAGQMRVVGHDTIVSSRQILQPPTGIIPGTNNQRFDLDIELATQRNQQTVPYGMQGGNGLPAAGAPIHAATSDAMEGFQSSGTAPAPMAGMESGMGDTTQSGFFKSLTGELVRLTDFRHDNMVPFIKGAPKQNTTENANQSLLDTYTGAGSVMANKREQKPLFSFARKNMSNPYGMESSTDFIQDRMRDVAPTARRNELPFEQVRVGPGLDDGYTARGTGGFHDLKQRDAALPRTVDELRVKTRPKVSYEGRINVGKSLVTNRGLIGEVRKNRPDRFWINHKGERNLGARAEVLKPRVRSQELLRFVARPETTQEYFTPAGPAEAKKSYVVGEYRDSHNAVLPGFGVRNATATDRWNTNTLPDGAPGDYGKSAIEIRPTERIFMEENKHILNLKSIVEAIVTPIQDVLEMTRKEFTIGNARETGNFKAEVPANVVWDPEDVVKTTVRETLESHDYIRNMSVADKAAVPVYDPDDAPRTTGRETLDSHDYMRNMSVADKAAVPVYDPDDVARTTGRETLDGIDWHVNLAPAAQSAAHTLPLQEAIKHTLRQGTHTEYVGIATGTQQNGGGDGYIIAPADAPETLREGISETDYKGIAGAAVKKQVSYESGYNARVNAARENNLQGRFPVPEGSKEFQNQVNVEIRRIDGDIANTYVTSRNRLETAIPSREQLGVVTSKQSLQQDVAIERMHPSYLQNFYDNPYAIKINPPTFIGNTECAEEKEMQFI